MAELEQVLGEMCRINDRMLVLVSSSDEERNRQIVELRQEFSTETGNLITLLPSEKSLAAQPELFSEFQDRLSIVRRKLASHQTKWTIKDITTHRSEYLDASRAVHGSIADYLSWAHESLSSH